MSALCQVLNSTEYKHLSCAFVLYLINYIVFILLYMSLKKTRSDRYCVRYLSLTRVGASRAFLSILATKFSGIMNAVFVSIRGRRSTPGVKDTTRWIGGAVLYPTATLSGTSAQW